MGGCGGDGDGSVLEAVLVVVALAVVGDAVVMGDVVIITMMMSLLTAVRGLSPCTVQSAQGAPPGHLQHSATGCPLRRRHTVLTQTHAFSRFFVLIPKHLVRDHSHMSVPLPGTAYHTLSAILTLRHHLDRL